MLSDMQSALTLDRLDLTLVRFQQLSWGEDWCLLMIRSTIIEKESPMRPRIPCSAALSSLGVPARKWATRADVLTQLEQGRALLAADPHTSVLQAASVATMSPEHFLRMFTVTYGMRPKQYLAKSRLENARIEVESTNDPIWKVAQKFGFQDSSAFCRAFRREFGVSPTQARKTNSQFQHTSGH